MAPVPDPGPPARPDEASPLLLIANHTSWFDGFLLRELQRSIAPRSALRTLMLSRELDGWAGGRPVLRQLGGTGFDPDRPMTLRGALKELRPLRDRPGGLAVAFFPQGRIFPSFRSPPGFRRGVTLVIRQLAPVRILPVGLHLEAGPHTRPAAWILPGRIHHVSSPDGPEPSDPIPDATSLGGNVAELTERIRRHLAEYGEDAPAHWPPPDRNSQDPP